MERRFRSTIDLESYAPESPPTDNPKSSRKKPKHRVEVSEIAEDMTEERFRVDAEKETSTPVKRFFYEGITSPPFGEWIGNPNATIGIIVKDDWNDLVETARFKTVVSMSHVEFGTSNKATYINEEVAVYFGNNIQDFDARVMVDPERLLNQSFPPDIEPWDPSDIKSEWVGTKDFSVRGQLTNRAGVLNNKETN